MNLRTRYLGLELKNPLMLGASPLVGDLDAMRRAEDAGASAVVMRSLFEEQIPRDGEGGYYPPDRRQFAFRPSEYLEQIRRLKSALGIPVIGSLNGVTRSGWLDIASQIDQAGADALELNVYRVSTDFDRSSDSLENETVDLVRATVERATIPVAVKLSPFYTSLPHFAERLVNAGAKGLILFNRFLQPGIDLSNLVVEPSLDLSTSAELPLRLRWLAILSARLQTSFAVTGGVHNGDDALKAILTGAHGVQLVSEIIQHGFVRFRKIEAELVAWLAQHEKTSLDQVRGTLNLRQAADPEGFERANYLRMLHSYPPVRGDGAP
jgi:dihydroorotate dehydrogenase (fumarate)